MGDLICRRYRGAYKHPLDPELIDLPWWLKEAIWRRQVEENLPEGPRPPSDVWQDTYKLADWSAREKKRR